MRLRLPLVVRGQKPYHYFMHTPGVTQCLHLPEGEKGRVWTGYGDVRMGYATFLGLSTGAEHVSYEDVAVLEHFTILLYDRTSNLTDIDEARLELFMNKG